MNKGLELLETTKASNLIFDVDYSTIRESKIKINRIVLNSDFKYRYDENGNLLNYPVYVSGTCWNKNEMCIYNS